MPIKQTVSSLQRLIQQMVGEMESSREPATGSDRVFTRAVALLWAAHDELDLAVPMRLSADRA